MAVLAQALIIIGIMIGAWAFVGVMAMGAYVLFRIWARTRVGEFVDRKAGNGETTRQ
jgi:hypothetical protein